MRKNTTGDDLIRPVLTEDINVAVPRAIPKVGS